MSSVASTRSLPLRVSAFFHRHPAVRLALFLLPGLLWLGLLYLGSLGSLVLYSLWSLEEFTGLVVRRFTLSTFAQLAQPANYEIVLRTVGMAAAVSVACALLAFPISYYMARYASPRMKTFLYIGVIMPLWTSYLVRALAWRSVMAGEGLFMWAMERLGLDGVMRAILGAPVVGGPTLVQSKFSLFVVYVYLWLPYMILPVQAALERVPLSYLEASDDLGARPGTTFRRIVLPLAKPGLVAGSIFTFSLTLGDFILPQIFGTSEFYLGQMVYVQQGVAGNLPLAAVFTFVAMAVMLVYLAIAKRAGAFEAL
ncbi:MAG: ABC transporter permease [Actinomycetota bacterium]|nr:MAG: ABC transporter permease [Actinomycetota bacterium]